MKTRLFLLVIGSALVALAAIAAAQTAPSLAVTGSDAALVQLDEPAAVMQADGSTVTYKQAYLVRVFGSFPRYLAVMIYVYFGDQQIVEYGSFPGGIYFLVYDRAKLMALAGQDIKVGFQREGLAKSGHKFEPTRFDLTTPVPLRQALERGPVAAR